MWSVFFVCSFFFDYSENENRIISVFLALPLSMIAILGFSSFFRRLRLSSHASLSPGSFTGHKLFRVKDSGEL